MMTESLIKSPDRVKSLGEVFTPENIVALMLDHAARGRYRGKGAGDGVRAKQYYLKKGPYNNNMNDFINESTFIDDAFSLVGLNDVPTMTYVLNTIMNKSLTINRLTVQDVKPNIDKRSARFDVGVTDSDGRIYDIEVQRAKSGARPKRARFNSSIMDADSLAAGEDTEKLPESFVIFITETDTIGAGYQAYHIDRVIHETGKPFDDAAHIIYVNVENADLSTELGKMLHDFKCADPNEMYSSVLRKRMIYVKNNPEEMRKVKNYYETYEQNAYEKGRTEGILDAIKNMINFGIPESKIEEKYSKEQVEAAKKMMNPTA